MSSFVNQQDFNEMLIWETAIIMLRKPERDMPYGDEASWHFIETVLTGENDRKACIHFLKSEAAHLAKLGTECIKVGSERSRELCFCSATVSKEREVVQRVYSQRGKEKYSNIRKKGSKAKLRLATKAKETLLA